MDPLTARILEAARDEEPEQAVWMQIWTAGYDAYICPVCQRFFIRHTGSDEIVASYVKE